MELRRFRLRLDPLSAFGTPPTSGTLFGHLCWAKRARDGRAALRDWLTRLPQEPCALSDMLPADHLPRPLLAPVERTGPDAKVKPPRGQIPAKLAPVAQTSPDEDAKKLKRRRHLPLDAWKRLRIGANGGELERLLRDGQGRVAPDPAFLAVARVPHNRIDRNTGSTPAAGGGGLWFADDLWPEPAGGSGGRVEADLYLRSTLTAGEAEKLIADLGEIGFGRDASIGRGRFAVEGSEAVAWLDEAPRGIGAARMLSLSQGVITANMGDARWKRFVLFGKLGRAMVAEGKRPWKLPLLLAEAGATFAPQDGGPFGAWITGTHQDDAEIGHNGFHLAIPYTEAQA